MTIRLSRVLRAFTRASALCALVFSSLAQAQPASFPSVDLPERVNGTAAIRALGNRLPDVAAAYGMSPNEFAQLLRTDSTLWLDQRGHAFYVEPAPVDPDTGGTDLYASAPYPLTDTFSLESRPGAPRVIYLDFTGHETSGTAWNQGTVDPIISPPYDRDGNPDVFSDSELREIQLIWRQVSEDFAPFNVNVTTRDPGASAITRSGSADGLFGTRVVFTVDNFDGCGCGGFAYLGAFDNTSDYLKPAFVFNRGVVGAGEAATHEVGHNLSLRHDGQTGGPAYYTGHGDGETGWAPIMGVGYYQSLVQWSRGEYAGADNSEDDLAMIQATGAPLLVDDHGGDPASATDLELTSNGSSASFSDRGVIGSSDDVDLFRFFAGAGSFSISAAPLAVAPNLDIELTLLDAAGGIVGQSNPADVLAASLTGTLSAGEYWLRVDGVGKGDPAGAGYSDYGSLGFYAIAGSVADPQGLTPPEAVPAAPGYVPAMAPLYVGFDGSASVDAVDWQWDFGDGASAAGPLVNHTYEAPGEYTVTLTVLSPDGLSDSAALPITVINQPPVARVLTDGVGGTAPITISFDASASYDPDASGRLERFSWDFGDGASAEGESVTHTYASAGDFRAELTVEDDLGGTGADAVTISVDPPPFVDQFASAELMSAGTLRGSYADTRVRDGLAELLTEIESGGKPSRRFSYLEHAWDFSVMPGAEVTLFVTATGDASADGDSFDWFVSVGGGQEQALPLVLDPATGDSVATLPSSGGQVRLIVRDSDRTAGNRSLDTLAVDALRIRTVIGDVGSPPDAPGDFQGAAEAGAVRLSWIDVAGDEYGYRLSRYTSADGWVVIASLPADSSAYVDSDVAPATAYAYELVAFNAAGDSTPVSADALTPDAAEISLSASSFKEKGVNTVQLSWQGIGLGTLYRDGLPLGRVTDADSGWVDRLGKGGGTYRYQVCDDSGPCSNEVTVVF